MRDSKRGVSVHPAVPEVNTASPSRLVGISWDARIERASRAIEHEVSRRSRYGEWEHIRRDGRTRGPEESNGATYRS